MKKQLLVWILACLVVAFAAGTAYAAPSYEGEGQSTASVAAGPDDTVIKSVMLAAGKFLSAAPDSNYYRFDVKNLKMKVDSNTGDFFIVDVRPAKFFDMEHIAVSVNVPLPTLIGQLGTIPTDKTVYVVCALDSNSSYATAVLRMLGYDAYMVPGGEGAWKANGYPLVATAPGTTPVDRQTRSTPTDD